MLILESKPLPGTFSVIRVYLVWPLPGHDSVNRAVLTIREEKNRKPLSKYSVRLLGSSSSALEIHSPARGRLRSKLKAAAAPRK